MSCYFWPFEDRPCPYEQKPQDENDDGCSQDPWTECLGEQFKKEEEKKNEQI